MQASRAKTLGSRRYVTVAPKLKLQAKSRHSTPATRREMKLRGERLRPSKNRSVQDGLYLRLRTMNAPSGRPPVPCHGNPQSIGCLRLRTTWLNCCRKLANKDDRKIFMFPTELISVQMQ